MKKQTPHKKQTPFDILQVHAFLGDIRHDLTDVMMMAVDEWAASLQDDTRAWQDGRSPEPDWQSFREWMNAICRDDVMPLLFPKQPPEPPLEAQAKGPVEPHPEPARPAGFVAGQGGAFVAGQGGAFDYIPEWMQLPPLFHNEHHPNPLAIIKLFTPWSNWTWYLMESDGADLLFGLVVGLETEFGYVSLDELQRLTGPTGLHIERDRGFRPTPVRELPEYRERWGGRRPLFR